jgi:PAS domain S-box-containing protein
MVPSASQAADFRKARPTLALWMLAVLLAAFLPIAAALPIRSNSDIHVTMELFSALIGLVTGFALLSRSYVLGRRFDLLVGLAFVVNAGEDCIHGLLSSLNAANLLALSPGALAQAIPCTCVMGRILMSVLLLAAPFTINWPASKHPKRETWAISIGVLAISMAATYIAYFAPLPAFVYPSAWIARPWDFVSAWIFAAGFVFLFVVYRRSGDALLWWLLLSLILNALGQAAISFSRQLHDPLYVVSHVYKVFGYAVPLIGFSIYQVFVIHERQKSEDRLRQAYGQMQTIYDGIIEGILITDIATTRIVRVNASLCRMLGYSEEELLKYSIKDLHPPEEAPNDLQRFHAAAEGLVSINEDRPVLRKDGSIFYADITGHRIQFDGRPCLLALFRDITERKRAAQELVEAKQAAEAASRAKSEFLANMSHEIRTPMTAILGFADVLLGHPSDEESADAVRVIQRNGIHLLDIINDILDISKIEAGKLHVVCQPCVPEQIVAEVILMMETRAQDKGLSLSCETQGAMPERITTDPIRLRQILINLIGNAVKFTESGAVRVVLHRENGGDTPQLRIDVVDTGIGLSETQIGELFRPFAQADSSMHRRFGGTGLGLVISKRLANILGGDVAVSSTPGRGSIFSLTIAAGNASESDKSPAQDSASVGAIASGEKILLEGRILLAEDGADNQRLFARILRKAGAEVVLADNGQIAVEKYFDSEKDNRPLDLILMDIQMPVLDGLEATRQLRKAGCNKPIIALTAHAMSEDRQQCLDAGCDGYMSKPIDKAALLEFVAHYIGERRTADVIGIL